MARWTIDEPTTLDFDGVVALKATLVAGRLSVLAGDKPSVQVSEMTGRPVTVTHEAGMLTVDHEVWEGVLGWLRSEKTRAEVTITVPQECPIKINLVSADAVISGLTSRTSIKTGSGDITLDGVTGEIDAVTVSGLVEAQGLSGTVSFNSVSGELALAGGSVRRLAARTMGGKVTADIALALDGDVQIVTVAGEVALRLPVTTSAEVSLTPATGRVEAAFDGLDRTDRPVAKGLSGKLGDGSGRIGVNSVSGSVTLLSRPEDPALED
jgi:DUF4097 and DUF4098 domain-containing protein YvlB